MIINASGVKEECTTLRDYNKGLAEIDVGLAAMAYIPLCIRTTSPS